jgi:uncharacterized membrane protein YeiH
LDTSFTVAQVLWGLDTLGVTVCAVAGAMYAGRMGMDIFGAIVLGSVTALGGGTLRDVLLPDATVLWMADSRYLLLAVGVSIAGFAVSTASERMTGWLAWPDALGLSAFTIGGTHKAISMGLTPVPAMVMGLLTGVAGGVLRDILANEVPAILKREVYATASLAGSGAYLLLQTFQNSDDLAIVGGLLVCLILRLLAMGFRWNLPRVS